MRRSGLPSARHWGKSLDYQLLTDSFRATELDADMLCLLRQLRTEYRIALVTDNKSDRHPDDPGMQ